MTLAIEDIIGRRVVAGRPSRIVRDPQMARDPRALVRAPRESDVRMVMRACVEIDEPFNKRDILPLVPKINHQAVSAILTLLRRRGVIAQVGMTEKPNFAEGRRCVLYRRGPDIEMAIEKAWKTKRRDKC